MIHFSSPYAFFLLLVFPFLGLLTIRSMQHRRASLKIFLLSEKGTGYRAVVKLVLCALGLVSLAAALAQPTLLRSHREFVHQGKYVFLVDTSKSMDARATPASPSSLDTAKTIMSRAVQELPDGCFGIFMFEKLTFPASSLTCDHAIINDVLHKELVANRIPQQGTNLANALAVVIQRIADPESIYHEASIVVIFTDGGSPLSPDATDDLKAHFPSWLHLVVVGVGDPFGAPIPFFDQNGAFDGYLQVGGKTYFASLNEISLRNLADRLGGIYLSQNQQTELVKILANNPSSKVAEKPNVQEMDIRWVFLASFSFSFFVLLWRRDL